MKTATSTCWSSTPRTIPRTSCIRLTATNRGPDPAPLHLLPTLWFRNTWDFPRNQGRAALTAPGLHTWRHRDRRAAPRGTPDPGSHAPGRRTAGRGAFHRQRNQLPAGLRLAGRRRPSRRTASSGSCIHGEAGAVNPAHTGTKAALHYQRTLAPGETWVVKLRLIKPDAVPDKHISLDAQFDETFTARANRKQTRFYEALAPDTMDRDTASVQRQAFAGMLWNKQFYNYVVERWLDGDPGQPPPAASAQGRSQPRLAAPLQRRHPQPAGHLGVSVVRLVGPRLPLRCRWRWSTRSSPSASSCC